MVLSRDERTSAEHQLYKMTNAVSDKIGSNNIHIKLRLFAAETRSARISKTAFDTFIMGLRTEDFSNVQKN